MTSSRGASDGNVNGSLKQAALANGVNEELYDRVVNPLALTKGGSADLAAEPKRD